MPAGLDKLQHIVVLMMENRSFEHMLGSLKAVNPKIDGYVDGDPFTNPDANNNPVKPQPSAKFQGQLQPDPDRQQHDQAGAFRLPDRQPEGSVLQGPASSRDGNGHGYLRQHADG